MTKEEFLSAMQDILQCDYEISPDTELGALEEWDSLSQMGVVAFFDRKLGRQIDFETLGRCAAAADLLKLAGF